MLYPIFIVFKSLLRIKRRVDVDALHLTREFLLKRLQRQQVVSKISRSVENVVFKFAQPGTSACIRL